MKMKEKIIERLNKAPFKFSKFRAEGLKFVDRGYTYTTLYIIISDDDLYLLFRHPHKGVRLERNVYCVIKNYRNYYFTDVINAHGEECGARLLNDALISIYHDIDRLGYVR